MLVLLTLGLSCSQPEPTSFVLITIDTLRADHLGAYGYFRPTSPTIDQLAKEGVAFENAIAPIATTLPSHTSLMTSTYPVRHGILSNLQFYDQPVVTTSEIRTVAQMLRAKGYATAAFTSSSPLCEISGINAGFEVFHGPPPYEADQSRIDVPAEITTDLVLGWLSQASHPFFLWVHLFDPHHPYKPPTSFQSLFTTDTALDGVLRERHVAPRFRPKAAKIINQYDGEIRYADSQIARIFEALKARDLYERSVVVFTADHGEGLYENGIIQHGWIYNAQIRIPLIMRFPDGRRGRVTQIASLIDVLPTLAEEAGLPLDTKYFDGVNLFREKREFALSQREHRKPAWVDLNLALTSLDWKYQLFEGGEDLLVDIRKDPHETRNVLDEYPMMADRMRREIMALVVENGARSPLVVRDSIPPIVIEQLRSLGYVD